MMDLQWLKGIAPTLLSALAGPYAQLAVTAVGAAMKWNDATKDDVVRMLTTGQLSPEQMSAVKTAEIELRKYEMDNNFRFADLEVRDRESARMRDVELAKAGQTNYLRIALSIITAAGIALLTYFVIDENSINEFAKGVITLALGRLWGYMDSIFQFEFGRTRSGEQKDATINKLAG
jgi:hypothetical protein